MNKFLLSLQERLLMKNTHKLTLSLLFASIFVIPTNLSAALEKAQNEMEQKQLWPAYKRFKKKEKLLRKLEAIEQQVVDGALKRATSIIPVLVPSSHDEQMRYNRQQKNASEIQRRIVKNQI